MQCRKEKLYNDKEGRQKSMRLTKNRAQSEPRIEKMIENATRRKAKNGKRRKKAKWNETNYIKLFKVRAGEREWRRNPKM